MAKSSLPKVLRDKDLRDVIFLSVVLTFFFVSLFQIFYYWMIYFRSADETLERQVKYNSSTKP